MKKIFLSTSNVQPIPAVLGGATETLIDILITKNEIEKKCLFFILCKYNADAQIKSKDFKYTKVIYFKSRKDSSIFELLKNKEIFFYFIAKALSRLGFIKTSIPPRYYFLAYRLCKIIKPDYFVAEGGMYEKYAMVSKVIPPERRYAHLHRVVNGNKKLWSIFPNAIAISNYVKNAYIGNQNLVTVSAKVVPNCCNETVFQQKPNEQLVKLKRRELNFNDDDFVVIFSGRIVEEKGVKELLLAIENIPIEKVKLLIVGSPFFASSNETEYWAYIQKIAASLGDRVCMTGYVPNNELSLYFSLSSLCVVPSVWEEPVALVPLEAMTFGLPVIVTNSGGMVEYQKDNCILVVDREPDLTDTLCKAISSLYNDKELRKSMITKGKLRAGEFSSHKFYYDFLNVFKESIVEGDV
ncbi:glycosyltransferase family 4 protein [Amylibacter sp.]|jgi:glycosyltransferase involved in cell wall biosynthesis|nr:glycosyltransferase family 4 protein [Amylibacter sp.]MDC1532076.1 glycosyltransferase family 4 protein [Amylibacter sp.]